MRSAPHPTAHPTPHGRTSSRERALATLASNAPHSGSMTSNVTYMRYWRKKWVMTWQAE